MAKTSTAVKARYNKKTYRDWRSPLKFDLFDRLENFRAELGMSRSQLLEYFLEKEVNEMKVTNRNGTPVDFEVAVELMGDKIYKALNDKLAPCTGQKLFTEYEKAHIKKFGEEWELSKENPVY